MSLRNVNQQSVLVQNIIAKSIRKAKRKQQGYIKQKKKKSLDLNATIVKPLLKSKIT